WAQDNVLLCSTLNRSASANCDSGPARCFAGSRRARPSRSPRAAGRWRSSFPLVRPGTWSGWWPAAESVAAPEICWISARPSPPPGPRCTGAERDADARSRRRALDPVVYLDSSALVKLVVAERESTALRRSLRTEPRRASCALARVEVVRAVRPHGGAAITRAR